MKLTTDQQQQQPDQQQQDQQQPDQQMPDQQQPGVNFINILRTNFLYKRLFSMYMCSVIQKICKFNVNEIDNST